LRVSCRIEELAKLVRREPVPLLARLRGRLEIDERIGYARALARNVAAFLDGTRSAGQVRRSLDAFWHAAAPEQKHDL
jgi:hypothetical protein